MKQLGVLLLPLDRRPVHRRVTLSSDVNQEAQKNRNHHQYPFIHLGKDAGRVQVVPYFSLGQLGELNMQACMKIASHWEMRHKLGSNTKSIIFTSAAASG